MKTHRDLKVWQDGIALVKLVYSFTSQLPEGERFGLVSQMRRAAVSVPSNLAEGAARGSRQEFARFVAIDRGSVAELETQAIIAAELGFPGDAGAVLSRITELYARLNKLYAKLSAPPDQPPITNHQSPITERTK